MAGPRLQDIRQRLQQANRVAVLTGAGVSAESGVPTFRGAGGLWEKFDVMTLASPEGFAADPKLVWEFYDHRRRLMSDCQPNPGHQAIAELERRAPEFLLVTQNIDGLHRLAGSQHVAEMHGNIWHVCRPEAREITWENREVPLPQIPLRDADGNLLRPAVVWFGEMLPLQEVAKMEAFFATPPDVLLVAGTSSLITWVQYLVLDVLQAGGFVVEINPEETDLSPACQVCLRGRAGELLPRLL